MLKEVLTVSALILAVLLVRAIFKNRQTNTLSANCVKSTVFPAAATTSG